MPDKGRRSRNPQSTWPGRWEDRALHVTMAQHPRRSGAVERDGQRDDRGVRSWQPAGISSMAALGITVSDSTHFTG